jgi:CHASE3 domain sensor protein
MTFFNNFRVGTKIIAGYIIALVLMLVVGGTALVRLNDINTVVTDLSGNLAKDQAMAENIVSQIWTVRFFVLRYINMQEQTDLDRYNQEIANFKTMLATADQEITHPERIEMLVRSRPGCRSTRRLLLKSPTLWLPEIKLLPRNWT